MRQNFARLGEKPIEIWNFWETFKTIQSKIVQRAKWTLYGWRRKEFHCPLFMANNSYYFGYDVPQKSKVEIAKVWLNLMKNIWLDNRNAKIPWLKRELLHQKELRRFHSASITLGSLTGMFTIAVTTGSDFPFLII